MEAATCQAPQESTKLQAMIPPHSPLLLLLFWSASNACCTEDDLDDADDLASDALSPVKKWSSKHEFSPSLHLSDLTRQKQTLQANGLNLLTFSYSHSRIPPFSKQACPTPKHTRYMHFYSLPRLWIQVEMNMAEKSPVYEGIKMIQPLLHQLSWEVCSTSWQSSSSKQTLEKIQGTCDFSCKMSVER